MTTHARTPMIAGHRHTPRPATAGRHIAGNGPTAGRLSGSAAPGIRAGSRNVEGPPSAGAAGALNGRRRNGSIPATPKTGSAVTSLRDNAAHGGKTTEIGLKGNLKLLRA